METTIQKKLPMKSVLKDILLDMSWAKIAQNYFGKSSSWMYHKMDGIDGNGGEGNFTYSEKLQLRNALYDFSDRVKVAADKINV
jgi:hypothetical protein